MTPFLQRAIADAIKHSMRRILPDINIVIMGQCTDSGSGGTKFALAQALTEMNMASANYLVCTCSLHNLQTCLRNDTYFFWLSITEMIVWDYTSI